MLTRGIVRRTIAAACVGAVSLVPAASAHAATTGDQVATTTNAIDAAAQRWFVAQADASQLDASIADIARRIETTQRKITTLRKIATARAVVLYKNSDVGMASLIGDTALDSARRAHLADDANAGADAAISDLETSVENLDAQRHELEQRRRQLHTTLAVVADERQTLDTQLQALRRQARREADAALAEARDRAARQRAIARVHALAAASQTVDPLAAPTGAPLPVAPTTTVAPLRASTNTGRVSAHHDDPFLVCTRARESAGQYDAVSPSGYYGAYQFLPSTWDTTAVHASRSDLVGVLPSRASEYDQDEMAWALYQWQGNSPWGGRC